MSSRQGHRSRSSTSSLIFIVEHGLALDSQSPRAGGHASIPASRPTRGPTSPNAPIAAYAPPHRNQHRSPAPARGTVASSKSTHQLDRTLARCTCASDAAAIACWIDIKLVVTLTQDCRGLTTQAHPSATARSDRRGHATHPLMPRAKTAPRTAPASARSLM